MVKFRWFFVGGRGVVHLFGTPLKENCRAPLAGMASSKSEGKAEALGITVNDWMKILWNHAHAMAMPDLARGQGLKNSAYKIDADSVVLFFKSKKGKPKLAGIIIS